MLQDVIGTSPEKKESNAQKYIKITVAVIFMV